MEDEDLVAAATELGAVEVMRKDGVGPASSAPLFARVQRVLGPLLALDTASPVRESNGTADIDPDLSTAS
jgi:hypothetical protein